MWHLPGVAEAIQHWSGLGVAINFFSISIAAILRSVILCNYDA